MSRVFRPLVHLAAALLLPALAGPARAQAAPAPPPHSPVIVSTPAADPADVASPESLVAALYDVISGPVGEPRDWNRFRSLFVPGGRLLPVGPRAAGGHAMRIWEVNDYIALSGAQLEAIGFREREITSRVERFGNIAHVFSTYEAFRGDETTPFLRGINSIQAMFDGTRWWVVTVFWEAERPDNPIPEAYLPRPAR
jgi:hypothetical protein